MPVQDQQSGGFQTQDQDPPPSTSPAPRYEVLQEFSGVPNDDDLTSAPYWCVAVYRLGKPLSYSRMTKKSDTQDLTEGAKLRGGGPLVITSDCLHLTVQRGKAQHLKNLSMQLLHSGTNYLLEILPKDWCVAWMVHGRDKLKTLVERIRRGEACNKFDDGLKFVGRVEDCYVDDSRAPGGQRTTRYDVQAYGFHELDTQVFYDPYMAQNSLEAHDLGSWLGRIGLDIREFFEINAKEQLDNVHKLIPTLLEILVGRGVSRDVQPTLPEGNQGPVDTRGLDGFAGGGQGGDRNASFAYLVPKEVGQVLGRQSRDPNKAHGILAYADILDVVFGVQTYENTNPSQGYKIFCPKVDTESPLTYGTHQYTGTPMLGAFLPIGPDFCNRPLWSTLQQYLNPEINEMYTCMRVDQGGNVVPTLVVRQIPFTSDVLRDKLNGSRSNAGAGGRQAFDEALGEFQAQVAVTPYSSLPRWVMSPALTTRIRVGRSAATACNFVHMYGQNAENTNEGITNQIVRNPPIQDALDIQRAGLQPYMSTVAARVINEIGTTPGVWMELIADHRIGSEFTLNGTLVSRLGIQAPICEGDNLEFDGVVYHIEQIVDSCTQAPGGQRTWTTTLSLSNGLRYQPVGSGVSTPMLQDGQNNQDFPQYPGIDPQDATQQRVVGAADTEEGLE